MQINFDEVDPMEAYKILGGVVTPRPIALVTTIDANGVVNAAPFSFFNYFGGYPPIVCFAPLDKSPDEPKDTASNIIASGEFVINLVDENIANAMNDCATPLPAGVSELDKAGLSIRKSKTIKPPGIAESPVNLECKKLKIVDVGNGRLVIGTVQSAHIADGILDPRTHHIIEGNFFPIGKMNGPNWYTKTRDKFELNRPK